MANGTSLIKKGHVESVYDTSDGLRIKVRLQQDGKTPVSELPYAFPLLPKTFQSVPKVGEGAFIITTMSDNKESQRYYLGPIISQPQFQGNCTYNHGVGPALSLIKGGTIGPKERISNYNETVGAFPEIKDVAMVGRGSQDVILKNNKDSDEIDIRCGIRTDSVYNNTSDPTKLKGKVIFNKVDPAYIQLKYKRNLTTGTEQEANSIINLVADKINIISNKDENSFNLTDQNELIPNEEIDNIMSKLHQVPHGDTLIKLLSLIINAIITHVHPMSGMQPSIADYVKDMIDFDTDEILSKHVRIS